MPVWVRCASEEGHRKRWWAWLCGLDRGLVTHLGDGQVACFLNRLPPRRAQFSAEDWALLGEAYYKYLTFAPRHTRSAQK